MCINAIVEHRAGHGQRNGIYDETVGACMGVKDVVDMEEYAVGCLGWTDHRRRYAQAVRLLKGLGRGLSSL